MAVILVLVREILKFLTQGLSSTYKHLMLKEAAYSVVTERALKRTFDHLYKEYKKVRDLSSETNIRLNPHFENIISNIKESLDSLCRANKTTGALLGESKEIRDKNSVQSREEIKEYEGTPFIAHAYTSYLYSYAYDTFITCLKSEVAAEARREAERNDELTPF